MRQDRAIARPWLTLDAEVKDHDASLGQLTQQLAPELVQAHGVGTGAAAEMLILVGDNPERIHSEAALAKPCGACPVPASSGKTTRHRLNRGGHRHANAALYRVVIVRMRAPPPILAYVKRRSAEGKSKPEIIGCLKRFVAREIFGYLCRPPNAHRPSPNTQRQRALDHNRSIAVSVIGTLRSDPTLFRTEARSMHHGRDE